MAASGAERVDQLGVAEAAQEIRRTADDLRGPAHRVCGVVLVVEHVIGLAHALLHHEGPGARSAGAQGLRVRNTIYRQVRRVVVSAPAAKDCAGCEDRISVTEDHLSFDGNCGVRAGGMEPAGGGRSNGVRPPLSSDFLTLTLLSAGVRTPRDFMAPNTCDGTYCFASGGRFVGFSDDPSLSTRQTLASEGEHVY